MQVKIQAIFISSLKCLQFSQFYSFTFHLDFLVLLLQSEE